MSARWLLPSYRVLSLAGLALGAVTGGCVWSVPEPVTIREPRPEPIPLRIGVYYSPQFRDFTYRHHATDTAWILGKPSVRLLNESLALIFAEVVESGKPGVSSGLPDGIAGVIEPVIVSAGYTYPTLEGARRIDTVCFQLHLNYGFTLYSPKGERLASWEVDGQDCAPETRPMATLITRRLSFERTMREDAWKLITGFRDVPGIRRWLDEQGVH